ncbi:MAG TPA: serine hydrolase domain-containing protein [Longimicrobium sp.]
MLLALVSTAAGCAPPRCPPVAAPPPRAAVVRGAVGERLDGRLRALADSRFAGAVLVMRRGETLLRQGYGRTAGTCGRPVTPATGYWIGSLSKSFAAAAILRLEEEGRLRTTDSIGRFFTGLPTGRAGITLHQLLTHTGGLGHNYAADGTSDRSRAVAAILRPPAVDEPGTRFHYSNDGYNLLAAVVETAAGEPYDAYVQRMLIGPAGLRSSGPWDDRPAADALGIAPPRNGRGPAYHLHDRGYMGATGIHSTVDDLVRWLNALRGGRVLRDSSIARMWRPYVAAGARGEYGYGWFISTAPGGGRVVEHGGTDTDLGHNAVLWWRMDDDVVISIASASGEPGGVPASRRVRDALIRLLPATGAP